MRKQLSISKDINDSIKAYSKEQGITHSQVVEIACRAYFRLYEASKSIKQSISDIPGMIEPKDKSK